MKDNDNEVQVWRVGGRVYIVGLFCPYSRYLYNQVRVWRVGGRAVLPLPT
jgi:hypothetical protein